LYFLPDPHGHGSLRPIFADVRVFGFAFLTAVATATSPESSSAGGHRGSRAAPGRFSTCSCVVRLRHFFLRADLDRDQRLRHLELDRLDHRAEQLERLALVFLLRILLRVAAQVNPWRR
jgi:hypothetical protein